MAIKKLINTDYFTERVREIAMKHELESLTKTSITDLGEGLVEVFHSIISDLI